MVTAIRTGVLSCCWGVSSAGRASGLQPEGHRFDPGTLHCRRPLAPPGLTTRRGTLFFAIPPRCCPFLLSVRLASEAWERPALLQRGAHPIFIRLLIALRGQQALTGSIAASGRCVHRVCLLPATVAKGACSCGQPVRVYSVGRKRARGDNTPRPLRADIVCARRCRMATRPRQWH